MKDKETEELELTNYVCEHFKHLMTEAERLAIEAIVFYIKTADSSKMDVAYGEGISEESINEATHLLKDGQQICRKIIRDRLIKDYHQEIFANKCSKCGKLPRTPKSKQCHHCHHNWHTN